MPGSPVSGNLDRRVFNGALKFLFADDPLGAGPIVSRVDGFRHAEHINVCWNRPDPIVLMM